jgi:hypothetical protein
MKNYMETEFLLDSLRESYEKVKNPLFIWEAFKICREDFHAIPGWVLEYLDAVADKLLELPNKYESGDPGQRASADICSVLGMKKKKGARSVFSNYRHYKNNQEIVSKVCERIVKQTPQGIVDDEKVTHAMRKVAKEFNVEYGTVRKLYYEWLEKMELDELEKKIKRMKKRANKK